jgi:hypothetical protein
MVQTVVTWRARCVTAQLLLSGTDKEQRGTDEKAWVQDGRVSSGAHH